MSEKVVCMICKATGAKSLIPYKVIEDRDGVLIRFRGQLCERCFNTLIAPAQKTDGKDENK